MKKILTKKRIIWSVIIIVVLAIVGFMIFKPKSTSNILTEKVGKHDLEQTVLATGQVTSNVDLDLNFQGNGPITRINVKVGDKVRAGSVLATLDQKDAAASIAQARAQVLSAQANLDKVINGASDPDVQIAQVTYDNALSAMLNSTPEAIPSNNATSATVTISGTYTGIDQGQYDIKLYASSGGITYVVTGLGNVSSLIKRGLDLPIGQGLYINFGEDNYISTSTTYSVPIPNVRAADYLTNYNAFKSAESNLAQKQAAARPEDVSGAKATLASAQANLQIAENAYEDTIIRAPVGGTITDVNIKIGEKAGISTPAIVLQDVSSLYLEANVSEANVAVIHQGQEVTVTYDALGPDKIYKATVENVDPSSTVVSGVVNYKVTSSIEPVSEIKPGMTANLTILTGSKQQVLAIPQRAVLNHDGKKFVRVVTDTKKKTYTEQEITVGMQADGGLVEILSGLSEGVEIVTFINK